MTYLEYQLYLREDVRSISLCKSGIQKFKLIEIVLPCCSNLKKVSTLVVPKVRVYREMPERKWFMVGDSYPSCKFIPTSTHEHNLHAQSSQYTAQLAILPLKDLPPVLYSPTESVS